MRCHANEFGLYLEGVNYGGNMNGLMFQIVLVTMYTLTLFGSATSLVARPSLGDYMPPCRFSQ